VTEEIPARILEPSAADALRVVTRAVFQAGLSWRRIADAWDAFEAAFEGFDVTTIAAYDDGDVERLMNAEGIVHSRRKLAATVANARAIAELDARPGGILRYVRDGDYATRVADLRARFAFVGELSAYYVVFRLGGGVPRFEDWERDIPGDHPRMRAMIARARSEGWDG